ncbi:Uncharacterised protein [Klebsiella variicola]|nr:Uncharacterised protein [Klebsiella variicola]
MPPASVPVSGGSELALAEGEIAGYAAAGASQQAQALLPAAPAGSVSPKQSTVPSG